MSEPENFNIERIKFFIEENMSLNKSGVMGGVKSSQAGSSKIPFQAPVAPAAVSKSMGQQPPKKKEEDNLDDLMMM